jgi:glutathione synthase/RimK-type ligase-like ATP-grasp enzyme
MRFLGLEFGGIDFALVDGTFYFIEVNPTGEWGWLVSVSDLPIDKAIVNSLVMETKFD